MGYKVSANRYYRKNNLQNTISDADIIYHLAGITDVGTTVKDKNPQRDRLIKKVGIEGTKNIIDLSSKETKIVFPSTHVIFEGLKSVEKNILKIVNLYLF